MAAFNSIEFIWNSLEKTEDGQKVRYYPEDAAFLWDYGFVDTGQFSKHDWLKALTPFQQPDGTFVLNHDEFLTLDRYRYQGPVKITFDPMKINEGRYTDEGFQELVDHSIAPSCGLPAMEFKTKIDDLKKEFRQGDGLILLKQPAKLKIRAWLEEFPSPTRRRELMFDDFLKDTGYFQKAEAESQKASLVASPEQQAAIQASTFSQVPTTRTEAQAKAFKAMAKSKPKPQAKGPATTELKKVKRSRKGLRG